MAVLYKFFRILLRIDSRLIALVRLMQLILDHHQGISPLEPAWLDNQDVMLILKISERTLRRHRMEGRILYSRVNGKYYYKQADIHNMLGTNGKKIG